MGDQYGVANERWEVNVQTRAETMERGCKGCRAGDVKASAKLAEVRVSKISPAHRRPHPRPCIPPWASRSRSQKNPAFNRISSALLGRHQGT